MKNLTEEEIKKTLLAEYEDLDERKNDLRKVLKDGYNLTDKDKKNLQNTIEAQRTSQCEIVRIWEKIFNMDFATALDEILDRIYGKVNQ